MEQVELDLTEIRAELKKWLNQELESKLQSLIKELSELSQSPALEKRIGRLEAEVKVIRPAVEKMAKITHHHED